MESDTTSPAVRALFDATARATQVTKTLADLSPAEIAAIRKCCMRGGMMIVMMRNLAKGTIASPAGIRITMLRERGKLIAWFLMDCAAEYNPLLPEGCSIHFYTALLHRRRGLARALFESQLDFLAEQRRPLVAYVTSGRRAEFYRRLEARYGLQIRLSIPFLYLPGQSSAAQA